MDKQYYEEMLVTLEGLEKEGILEGKNIYLFGHCNATEELADLFLSKGYQPVAILDNNKNKHGIEYKNILIKAPYEILMDEQENTIVCIVARAYAAMVDQLRRLGYKGQVRKLVDYNSYSEYSLSRDTIERKKRRVENGITLLETLNQKYPSYFKIFCPFAALGDIYIMMSYLPHFLKKRNKRQCVICVVGNACAQVVQLFGDYNVEKFLQKDIDETIQAILYTNDSNTFIAHQDRPYVVNLHKALYVKCIPLEQIYCCGVFGLSISMKPYKPTQLRQYSDLSQIEEGKAVILSPYAKSVTTLPETLWKQIVESYLARGYQCFTNVVGNEQPLVGTIPVSPSISEIQSVVERAGTFIGIRSGLCDVLKYAKCKKIALYPDYNYSDTKWKAIDIYRLEGWENIVVK